MKPQSADTGARAERVQIELLRNAGLRARVERMRSLTRTSFALALRALKRKHPDWSRDQLFVELMALSHGQELADKLRDDLRRRGRIP